MYNYIDGFVREVYLVPYVITDHWLPLNIYIKEYKLLGISNNLDLFQTHSNDQL